MKNYFLVLIWFSVIFFSCKENAENPVDKTQGKKTIGKLNTDSVAMPVITPINPVIPRPAVTTTTKAFSLEPELGKESITAITPLNGLPLGSYYQAEQDDKGNLWFITNNRLIKYDGNTFTSYPPLPVAGGDMGQLALDKDNYVWIVIDSPDPATKSFKSSLYFFNGISFKQINVAPGKLNATGTLGIRLFPQKDKTIWVVNDELKLVLHFAGRELKRTLTIEDFSFKMITDIGTDSQGNAWFTDWKDSTLTRYDGMTFKKISKAHGLPDAILYHTIPVTADSIYLFTIGGTYFYNGQRSTKIDDNPASQSLIDDEGNIWLQGRSANVAVQKISPAGKLSIGKDDGLDITDNWLFGKDRENNIWVLSKNSINRLYNPVKTYAGIFPPAQTQRSIRSFYFDREGRYWFGSYLQGLACYNDSTLTNYSFLDSIGTNYVSDNNIGSITQDQAGNIWIGTLSGSLIKFDGLNFTINNKSNGFIESPIYGGMLADSKGNIWYPRRGSGQKGVACFNEKEKRTYSTAQGLCDNNVNTVFEDSKGDIWFGTSNGLSRLRNGRFTTYNTEDGLAGRSVNSIVEDDYGNLCLGTDGGISRYNGEVFINYTEDDGLIENVINNIKKDAANKLFWIASESGFTAMRIRANHRDSVTFEKYSEAEGFPIKGGREFLVDRAGVLWTSEGNNSLKRFDHKRIKANSKPFSLHITEIRLNNKIICWNNLRENIKDSLALEIEIQQRFGKAISPVVLKEMARQFGRVRFDSIIPFDLVPYNLVLPYAANSISIDFAAIDPQFSKNTRYSYMLEGSDKTWTPLTKNNHANYANLREGRYTFRLKALNPYGAWSETSYSFRIMPPLYRTWWAYLFYAIFFATGTFLFIRWRTKSFQKEKVKLEEKVATRTNELKESLENLKAAQNQLIQSEKMASLGELTAGIAHEIQNPLNFVNNFSEINKELLQEMKVEIEKGKTDEINALADTIIENEEKINHHGKRADSIVKGMLHHSRRSSTNVKEPTNLNSLVDEYLRLAYHGHRAKDKSFTTKLETEFDPAIGNIVLVPQDIGRVLLNLLNNAFYAVSQRKKQSQEGYDPVVSIKTKKEGNLLKVSVTDNGNGIPGSVQEKIFQPFFTTKPTGEGTGLGLSLSYDIVKAHGGELSMVTKEGEGTGFTVFLPLNAS